ncbi:MAG: GNAT family N-acetyltransferase [Rubrivivax sp.]|nr:GNAT family N-acetyltransferase [Rubrivivax sp.]
MSLDPSPPHLRPAAPADLPVIVELIRELAAYERLQHMVVVTPESLHPQLFGPKPVAECVVAELDLEGEPRIVGFALFFTNFSTFLGRPGIHLEDLYVQPAFRSLGLGRMLLEHLAELAVARGCGRFEWTVLDWNESAIRFYERMGAQVLPDWRICRLSGEALERYG